MGHKEDVPPLQRDPLRVSTLSQNADENLDSVLTTGHQSYPIDPSDAVTINAQSSSQSKEQLGKRDLYEASLSDAYFMCRVFGCTG